MAQQVIPLTDGGNLVKRAISSFQGESTLFCKACMKNVRVAFEVKGTSPATDESGPIFWHFIEGRCGHELREMSS